METTISAQPSKGHLCWLVSDNGTVREAYQTEAGELYVANQSNCIDCQSGYRSGRWEGPAHLATQMLAQLVSAYTDHGGQVIYPEPEPTCYTCYDTGLTKYRFYCSECDAGRARFIARYHSEPDADVRAHMHTQVLETLYPEALDGQGPGGPTPTPGAPLAAPTIQKAGETYTITAHHETTGQRSWGVCLACDARLERDRPGQHVTATTSNGVAHSYVLCLDCSADPQTPATPALPAYNPEDGAPCAQCGHGQELHVNGTEDCWWSADATPATFCPCPRFQARDAAQRADEAAWLPMAGGSGEATIATIRTYRPGSVGVRLSCGHQVMLATEANLSVGQPWACPDCPRTRPLCVGCNHEAEDHEWMAGTAECGAWITSTEGCACRSYTAPMAGGAPSHYTDPVWLADEAWALQEERNAESQAAQRWDEGNGRGTCAACTALTDDGVWDAGRLLCPPCFDGNTAEPRSSAPGLQPALANGPRVARAALKRGCAQYTTPHTHPCPTCRALRPCTATGCADGPRECATCSQCRGW